MSDALIILRAAFPGAGEWHHNPYGSWWNDDLGVEVHVGPPPGTVLNARTISKLTTESKGHLYAAEQVYRATGLRILQGESGASYWERARKTLRVIPHPGNWAYGWAFDKRVTLAPSMPYPARVK